MGRFVALMVAAASLTAPALAQPTEVELATKYVSADADFHVSPPVSVESMEREFEQGGDRFPEDAKAWMRRMIPGALAQAEAEMDGIIRQRLIDAFVERFTLEELEDLVAKQAFLRQPAIMNAKEGSRHLGSLAQIEAVRQALAPEQFDAFIRTATSPVARAAAKLTVDQAVLIAKEYVDHIDRALAQHCPSAPKGVHLCENPPKPQ